MRATLSNDTVLEGEPGEIAAALREIGGDSTNAAVGGERHPEVASANAQVVWTETSVRNFWHWLYGDQKKLMEYLLKKNTSVSIEEIKGKLGLKTGNQVAGVLSSITRNARRETGYKKAMAYGYELKEGVWHYFVRPELVEILKKTPDA